MEKPLKCRLQIISPVHIGCDDVYEPTRFIIDEKKGSLIEFDPMDFIKSLNQKDREDFSKRCMGDDLLGIFKFIKSKYNLAIGGNEVGICKDLSKHYEEILRLRTYDKKIINQFIISKTAYNTHNSLPFIPGSTLKGALRTAYLSNLCKEQNIAECWINYLDERDMQAERDTYHWIGKKNIAKKIEEKLLGGSFENDPFRMVKVSDFIPVRDYHTKIVYVANNRKRKSDKPTRADSGPPQILEVIQAGAVFEGIINIQKPLNTSGINRPISDVNFLNLIHDSYKQLFECEKAVLEEIGAHSVDLGSFIENLGKSAFLIRVGRHSGAEAVTIEGNRYIKIMQKRGEPDKYSDQATTMWLKSDNRKLKTNLTPFGWGVLELLPFNIEGIYPTTVVTEMIEKAEAPLNTANQEIKTASQAPTIQTILWENASLNWSPGNKTLVATKDNKRADRIIGDNREIVPESLHGKLFERKRTVTANITVEPVGNNFRIVGIK
jgi:CRISPR-associated protein Csm5